MGLVGCDVVFGPEPSPTPTSEYPDVPPSPTPDIRFPTVYYNGEVPIGDGITLPELAGLPADSGVATEIALPRIERPLLITVTLRDGHSLNAEAYVGRAGMAGIALVGATFEAWGGLPVILRDAGYTVLTVEGQLGIDAAELSAVFDTLAVQPDVDASRLFVIGVEDGANVALVGCATQSRCVGAVLITPAELPSLTDAARSMGPRPILLAVSREDSASVQAADVVRQTAQNAVLQVFDEAGRGTQILNTRPDFVRLLREWLAAR